MLYYFPLSPFTNSAEQMCFVIILLSCDDPNGVQVPLPHPGDRRPLTGRTQQDRRGQSLSSSQHCPCQTIKASLSMNIIFLLHLIIASYWIMDIIIVNI